MTALEGHADDVDDEDQEKDEDYEYDVDDYNNEKRLSFSSVLRGILRSLQTISLDLQANAAAAPRFWCAKYKRKSLQIKTEECTMVVLSEEEMLWVFFRGSQLRKRLLCESFFISFIAPQSTFLIQLKWKCNGDAFTALH